MDEVQTKLQDVRLLVPRAAKYALLKHGQQLYGKVHPYGLHLAHVEEVLLRFDHYDQDLLAAAWLHDVIEDTDATYQDLHIRFGKRVADLVDAVSNRPGPNRAARHAETYPRTRATLGATTVKLADRIANTEFSVMQPMWSMYRKEYESFIEALYVEGENGRMWTHLDELYRER